MRVVVFCGPTLPRADVLECLPHAALHGPAAAGDVFRMARGEPCTIALIDGYFDHQLSVWHKEILWALSRGFRVYGASSMGALRAAELAPFGMIGVGKVFELYNSGQLEDDDEVAVVHDDAAGRYRLRSDAMVNIRATLASAKDEGVISAASERAWCDFGKRLFYPERSLTALVRAASSLGVPSLEVDAFCQYLERGGAIDQKREDALALLKSIRRDEAKVVRAASATFRFSLTNAWEVFTRKLSEPAESSAHDDGTREGAADLDASVGTKSLLALPADAAARVWLEAVERAFALVLADDDDDVDQAELQTASELFRRARGLFSHEQARAWMAESGVDLEGFSSLIYEEVLVGRHRAMVRRLAGLQVERVMISSAGRAEQSKKIGDSE